MIELEKVEQFRLRSLLPDKALNPRIQALIDAMNVGPLTERYIVFFDGSDIGFLSLDYDSDTNEFVISEFFILCAFRGRGFGTMLLRLIERLALDRGAAIIRLTATPMDDYFDAQTLIHWYCKRGYRSDPDDKDQLSKLLSIHS